MFSTNFELYLVVRFSLDNWNKLRNLCSKQIGEKMKVRHFKPIIYRQILARAHVHVLYLSLSLEEEECKKE